MNTFASFQRHSAIIKSLCTAGTIEMLVVIKLKHFGRTLSPDTLDPELEELKFSRVPKISLSTVRVVSL